MSERCGFWQNGSCGRSPFCLKTCRPAKASAQSIDDEEGPNCQDCGVPLRYGSRCRTCGNKALEYTAATIPLSNDAQGRSVCPISGVECGRDGKWCDECPKKPIEALTDSLLNRAFEAYAAYCARFPRVGPIDEAMGALGHAIDKCANEVIATKGTPAQPITDDEQAQLYAYVHGTSLYPIVRRLYSAASRATQPAPVDERAAFEALSLLLIEVELSGNGESTDFGWPRALAAARAALAAAPKPGEKT